LKDEADVLFESESYVRDKFGLHEIVVDCWSKSDGGKPFICSCKRSLFDPNSVAQEPYRQLGSEVTKTVVDKSIVQDVANYCG
jgi:hypothetical protein